MDVSQILKDPDFQGLPEGEKQKVLLSVDPDFAKLAPEEQTKVVVQLRPETIKTQETPKIEQPLTEQSRQPLGVSGDFGLWKDVPSNYIRSFPRDIGQALKNLAYPIVHPIQTGKALETLSPISASSMIKNLSGEPRGPNVLDAIKEQYGSPDKIRQSLSERPAQTTVDALMMLLGGKVTSAIGKPLAVAETKLSSIVRKGLEKGVRPTVKGKSTFGQTEKYFSGANDAVQEIIKSKNTGTLKLADETGTLSNKLPQNLSQFSEAIQKTRKDVFTKYHQMTKVAGQQGVTVDLVPIANEIEKRALSNVTQDINPAATRYALKVADRLRKRGAYTPLEAEEAIAQLNFEPRLKAYYQNPSHIEGQKIQTDAFLADQLRSNLDKAIESIEGPGYQELKNTYGSLKSIEKEVNQRAIVDARKNTKGLTDSLGDMFSGYYILRGIIAQEPSILAAGAGAKAAQKLAKWKNDPNRAIRRMFQEAEKEMKRTGVLYDKPTLNVIKDKETVVPQIIEKQETPNKLKFGPERKTTTEVIKSPKPKTDAELGIVKGELPEEPIKVTTKEEIRKGKWAKQAENAERKRNEISKTGKPLIKREKEYPKSPKPKTDKELGIVKTEKAEAALTKLIKTTPKIGKEGVSPDAIKAMETVNAFRKKVGLSPLDKFDKASYKKAKLQEALIKINQFRKTKGLPEF